jgi:hypothetical protein
LSPPDRTAICLTCRTALLPGEGCDADPAHPVASLDGASGRDLLVDATWGPLEVRTSEARLALHSEHAVALLAVFGFLAGLFLLWLIMPGIGPLHLLGTALTMALFWGGGNQLLARRGSAFPIGAPVLSLGDGSRLGLTGVAIGAPGLESPASGARCLAWALELHFVGYWGDRTMYRDAITSGFEVELDDGRLARVAAGRIRLLGPLQQVIDLDNLSLEEHLSRVDREHPNRRAFDPLRYNVVAEAMLLAGDRVELMSRFEPEPTTRAMPTGYRDPAPSILVARGIPVLRLLGDR